jgi:hypothetical protein
MGAEAGAGRLERSRRADSSSGLQIGECIKHRCWTVEVCGKPRASVAIEHRIKANFELSGEMCGEDLFVQREVFPFRRW